MKQSWATKNGWFAILAIGVLAGLGYWQREPIQAWYYVRQLSNATTEGREAWAVKVATLEEAALPGLFAGLAQRDLQVCANVQYALYLIAKNWGVEDPRTHQMAERRGARFADLSPAGQKEGLFLLTKMLRLDAPRPLPPRLMQIVSDILIHAERDAELRGPSLVLAAELVDCVQPGQWVDVCRGMAERGLKDEAAPVRIAAMGLLQREPMRKEKDLLALIVPALTDPSPAIRKAALIALAAETEVVRDEQFLVLLHDDDAELQYLCEIALRKRGLHDEDILPARMVSDKNPATRMRVLHHLRQMPESNLTEWLRRLSRDPSAAVRAAAVRAAGEYSQVDLADRLRKMAESDPSETVRRHAEYYLRARSLVQSANR